MARHGTANGIGQRLPRQCRSRQDGYLWSADSLLDHVAVVRSLTDDDQRRMATQLNRHPLCNGYRPYPRPIQGENDCVRTARMYQADEIFCRAYQVDGKLNGLP